MPAPVPDLADALATTLAEVGRHQPRAVTLLGVPPDGSWTSAVGLSRAGSPQLRAAIAGYAAWLGTADLRVAASVFLKRYTPDTYRAHLQALRRRVRDGDVPIVALFER